MGTGVLLIAIGSHFYAQLAYNLAKSIRKSSDIPITLLSDGHHNILPDLPFSRVREPSKGSYIDNMAMNPFKLKTFIYDYTPYENTLYLDVDGLFNYQYHEFSELLEELKTIDFHIQEVKRYTKSNRHRCKTVWLKDVGLTVDDLFRAYGLDMEDYPEYNSSFIWFKKNEANERYFKQAKNNYQNRKTQYKAIGGKYPDEMAWNLASAQLQHYNERKPWKPIYFQWEDNKLELAKIGEKYYFMGMAGGYSRGRLVGAYNRLAKSLPSPFHHFDNRKKIFHAK